MAKAAGFKAGSYSDYSYECGNDIVSYASAGSKDSKYSKTMFLKLRILQGKDLPDSSRRAKNSERWRKD